MKRWVVFGVTVAMVSGWGAQIAQGAVDGISGVTVAWADSTHVRVAWSETAAVANTVELHWLGLGTREIGTTTAAGANELVVSVNTLGFFDRQDDNTIVVKGADGGSASSTAFDMFVPRALATPSFTADGQVRWTIAVPPPDPSPGDPLDIAGTTKYNVDLLELNAAGSCDVVDVSDSAALTGVIPQRAKPYELVASAHNEWGVQWDGPDVLHGVVGQSELTMTAAGGTPYGVSTVISGTLVSVDPAQGITPPPCAVNRSLSPTTVVSLQARNTPTTSWYVVANGSTDVNGKYSFTVRNPGGREYRVLTGSRVTSALAISYGGSSATKLVRATTKLQSAKFISPVITYGTKPQAYLWVDPAGSQRAALQFKNSAGAWQGLQYKTLSSGRGIATFSWNRRGSTQFRWWVPGVTTSTGLKVDPIYTGAFALTVR